MCAKFHGNLTVRLENRLFFSRSTMDAFCILRSAPGPSPGLAMVRVGDHPGPPSGGEVVAVTLPRSEENVYRKIRIFNNKIFVFRSVDKSSLCCVQRISYLAFPRHVVPYNATCHLLSINLQAKATFLLNKSDVLL